jgi:SpoVK/Ycf46/Vps4 family AAA+-type ATPase
MNALASSIRTPYVWDDLVLPPDRVHRMHEIVRRVRHRAQVLEDWGFGRRHGGARGVTALFAGPPGTGKTMAAGIVAREVGCDLYRIDLSQVVSKYIGETEKQLERLFTEAEATDVALFFDEADALFGKRSAIKDAHDRYANIETGYLLQRLESYPGIAILATNLRKNMDEAFLRRLQVIVEFPFPGVEDRAKIWARVWPARAPVDADVDAADLARRFEISGGHIRNIAIAAAFAAAEEGVSISIRCVLNAALREFRKMNKLVDADRFALP